MRTVLPSLAMLLVLVGCGSLRPAGPPPETAEALVRAMHARYHDAWYRTLTLRQSTVLHGANGARRTETWFEALALPGRLRIDVAPTVEGDVRLFARDSVYVFQNFDLVRKEPGYNPLLVLGFDVYTQPPERTLAILAELGFDLSLLREDRWQGRPVYVVGARAGDLEQQQFWVDRDRLLFVRMLGPVRGRGRAVQDVRFERYRRLRGGWVAPEVLVYVDGRLVMTERYHDVRAGVALDPDVFDPQRWPGAPIR